MTSGASGPVRLLVVGYGSELHGDDAAGRVVAERVSALRLPGVVVRSVCQLVPELVDDLAGCGRVAFVDADRRCTGITVRPVPDTSDTPDTPDTPGSPEEGRRAVTHHATPAGLLRLAATVGTVPPPAVAIGIPAVDVRLGSGLSVRTRAGVEAAVAVIRQLAGAPATG